MSIPLRIFGIFIISCATVLLKTDVLFMQDGQVYVDCSFSCPYVSCGGSKYFCGIVVKIGDDFFFSFLTVQQFSLNCLQLLQFSVFVLLFFNIRNWLYSAEKLGSMWLKLVLKKKRKSMFSHSFAICFPQALLAFTLAMNVNKIAPDFMFHLSVCMLVCTYIHTCKVL